MKKENKKSEREIDIEYIMIVTALIAALFFLLTVCLLDDVSSEHNKPTHKCEIFIKYSERYMITPLAWVYRDSCNWN